MGTTPNQQDDLLEGIYQTEIKTTLTEPAARKFFPWHKPRKHYLRMHQWCAEVVNLFKINKYQEGDVIRYLGFPGEDFLDVRALQEICSKSKVWVRYLGFDSTASYAGQEFQFNLSQHEVFQLGYINQHSYVLKTRLEELADSNSMAYQRMSVCNDFDIINIDLCDSMASPDDADYPPYFEAIKNLCDIQIAGRAKPWVLFLTTRANRELLDADTKWKLFDCVLQNIRENADFAEQLDSAFALDDSKIRKELADKEQLSHGVLVSLFGLSIGKWLLKMMTEARPRLKVRLLKSYSYRVRISEPDMLSLAFIFEPITSPAVDRSGLSRPVKSASNPPPPTESELAIELLTEICAIEDVDELLKAPTLNCTIQSSMPLATCLRQCTMTKLDIANGLQTRGGRRKRKKRRSRDVTSVGIYPM